MEYETLSVWSRPEAGDQIVLVNPTMTIQGTVTYIREKDSSITVNEELNLYVADLGYSFADIELEVKQLLRPVKLPAALGSVVYDNERKQKLFRVGSDVWFYYNSLDGMMLLNDAEVTDFKIKFDYAQRAK